jgi:putative transposase
MKRNIRISRTKENHCYENVIAERVNRILKDEFYLDQCLFDTSYTCKVKKMQLTFITIKDYIYL